MSLLFTYAAGALSGLGVLAWLSAVVHALMLVGHRRKDISGMQLLVRGHLFFDAATFDEAARPIHRRFLRSATAFGLCCLLGVLLALAGTMLAPMKTN